MLIYDCTSTGYMVGFIEAINDSQTIFKIQQGGGLRSTYQKNNDQLFNNILNNISNEKASSSGENNSQLEDNQEVFTISDPDGYTNVREEKNSKSKILFKINEGEEFYIKSKDTDWWEIEFNGKSGFVHKSRIIPVGEQ